MKHSRLDHEKQVHDCEHIIFQLKEKNQINGIWADDEIINLEKKLEELKVQMHSNLSPWSRVQICRHPDRPRSIDYIKNCFDSFTEIFGDRMFRNDYAIITGFALIEKQKFVIIAQEKGCDTDSRIFRNFGMPHPEGYRKALRVMKLAEKFHLPVLSILDTPGAYPGLTAEERGQGSAIASNLFEMARLKTPVIIALIGEGCSGGALGMGVGDVVGMLEHAYYSVISPEGCASILWRDASKHEMAASALKMHAEHLLEFGIIDVIIKEPEGGAHYEPKFVYKNLQNFILQQIVKLSKVPMNRLLENRYQKFRKMGEFSIEETSQ